MSRLKTNPDTVDKTCPQCKKSFTISFYLRNKRTYCSKSCANHDPLVISRMIISQNKTFNEKYGSHPMNTRSTKENLKASIQKKYGVDWISKSDGWSESMKRTKKERYGDENYTNREKSKITCIEKYGVDNPLKSMRIKNNILETKKSNHFQFLQDKCIIDNIKLLFTIDEYKGYHFDNKYKFQCNKCNYIFETDVYNLESLYCEKCDPDKKKTIENSIFNFLTSLTPQILIKRHDRTLLYGKELDFLLPDKKTAIELNGLYWHSENGNKINKQYHLNKTKGCSFHGIRLIHIFENEWRDNPELVKSVIRTILKCNTNIIYARNCILKEVSIKEKNIFLDENHLQGNDKSTIKVGLYNNENLVSIMTFRKTSRFDKSVEWELSRFCNLKNSIVVGGASKLFNYFLKTYFPKSIVSYNDRRYFSGDLYPKLGFRFISNTVPSYHYITPDYKNIINRMNFQKHMLKNKLKIFDPMLSEWRNMQLNGFDRIWDCGCGKWVFSRII